MNVLLNSMVNLLSISTSRCPVLGPLLLSMLKEVDQQRTRGGGVALYQQDRLLSKSATRAGFFPGSVLF